MAQNILSVSQINEYIKAKLDQDDVLCSICVRGEISNYKLYPSGHHYFTLKDSTGSLRCVMFKTSAMRLRFRPENGMQILAFGPFRRKMSMKNVLLLLNEFWNWFIAAHVIGILR